MSVLPHLVLGDRFMDVAVPAEVQLIDLLSAGPGVPVLTATVAAVPFLFNPWLQLQAPLLGAARDLRVDA